MSIALRDVNLEVMMMPGWWFSYAFSCNFTWPMGQNWYKEQKSAFSVKLHCIYLYERRGQFDVNLHDKHQISKTYELCPFDVKWHGPYPEREHNSCDVNLHANLNIANPNIVYVKLDGP